MTNFGEQSEMQRKKSRIPAHFLHLFNSNIYVYVKKTSLAGPSKS